MWDLISIPIQQRVLDFFLFDHNYNYEDDTHRETCKTRSDNRRDSFD